MSQPSKDQSGAIAPSAFQPLSDASAAPKKRQSPLRWGAGLIALAFLLVMGFLFTSHSVQVTVIATSEPDISIDGLAVPFGSRYLMRPGDYGLTVNAPGYYPFVETVSVTREDVQVFEVVMQPLPGRLTISSVPEGARVLIDGESIGRTPLDQAKVDAGEHELTLEAERYQTLTMALDVEGRDRQQQLSLSLEPDWAEVTVATAPAGATLLLDGEPSGTTPATLEILSGERQLILRLATYSDAVIDLSVVAGQPQDLGTLTLDPAEGLLQVSSNPSGANVTLDGEFLGQTPLEIAVAPSRDQRLVLSRPGYRRHSEVINMRRARRISERSVCVHSWARYDLRSPPAMPFSRSTGKRVARVAKLSRYRPSNIQWKSRWTAMPPHGVKSLQGRGWSSAWRLRCKPAMQRAWPPSNPRSPALLVRRYCCSTPRPHHAVNSPWAPHAASQAGEQTRYCAR